MEPKGRSVQVAEQLAGLHISKTSTSAAVGGDSMAPTKSAAHPTERENTDLLSELTGSGSDEMPPQPLKATTLVFRDKETGNLDSCEVKEAISRKDDRVVYHSSWREQNAILKWWDKEEFFSDWRFDCECGTRAILPGNTYIPAIYAAGEVVQGPLKPGYLIIMEPRPGQPFSPPLWSQMTRIQRRNFRLNLRVAFASFREKNLVQQDTPNNVLWDRETEAICVIDWEDCSVRDEPPDAETYEIGALMKFCDDKDDW
ncbi:hypothetical protein ABW21_db0207929 [Orbilia brochopaga]|nr:hypothetical protein ABW21_db0207929 [Drechslerella brochopaga]